jgi:hypothetical protein
MVNGVALANRDKNIFCLGSDGSQQEGNDAEAARLAVAQNLKVKLLIDANDVTIAGHPSEYLKGFDIEKTLKGHGLKVVRVDGEDIDALWDGVCQVVIYNGPAAGTRSATCSFHLLKSLSSVVSTRVMAPGIPSIEGTIHAHDVIPVKSALEYFKKRGLPDYSDLYNNIKGVSSPYLYIGCTKEVGANRVVFGEAVNTVLDGLSKEEASKKVMVIDSELEWLMRCRFP